MRIYKTTNTVNGKIYIGQSRNNYKYYIGNGSRLKAAIKKYGKESFNCENIVVGDFSPHLLDELEKHYIRLYNSTDRNIGYNIEIGGLRGKYRGPSINIGIKRSQKFKDDCRKRALGKKLPDGAKLKLSLLYKGKPKTKEHSQNIGKAKRKPVLQYDLNWNFIKEWESITIASRELNIHGPNITSSCKGRKRNPGGFKWKYK